MSNLFNKINLFVKTATMSIDDAALILEVPISATNEEINRAYKHKMFKVHPDKFMNAEKETKQKMEMIAVKLNAARDLLLSTPQNATLDKLKKYVDKPFHNKKEWVI